MYCEKCGNKLEDNIEKCPNCGHEIKNNDLESEKNIKPKIDLDKIRRFVRKNLKYVYFILAIVVFFMFMTAATNISTYGINISEIESVGGKTLEEAYYYELGGIYAGYATVVRGIGIFISAALVWLGVKVKEGK